MKPSLKESLKDCIIENDLMTFERGLIDVRREDLNDTKNMISLIDFAISYQRLEMVGKLIEAGADINHQDGRFQMTPLHFAATRRHQHNKEMVAYLIDAGAHLNAQSNVGKTALHFAVEVGQADVIQHLLERGLDWRLKDQDERTALDSAKRLGCSSDIISLMEGFMLAQQEKEALEDVLNAINHSNQVEEEGGWIEPSVKHSLRL